MVISILHIFVWRGEAGSSFCVCIKMDSVSLCLGRVADGLQLCDQQSAVQPEGCGATGQRWEAVSTPCATCQPQVCAPSPLEGWVLCWHMAQWQDAWTVSVCVCVCVCVRERERVCMCACMRMCVCVYASKSVCMICRKRGAGRRR